MTGPGDESAASAAGRGPLRASHADREQVIEALKAAFVHGRLTKDELDARAGQALTARTYADLAAVTAGIPPGRAAVTAGIPPARVAARPGRPLGAAAPGRPLVAARRRPLARTAAKSGGCLALAAAAVWASFILDPGGPGVDRPWAGLMLLLAQYAVIAAACILWSGVVTSGRQLSPRPGPGGHPLDGGRRSGTGRRSVPRGPRADQTCADLRAHSSRPGRPCPSGRGTLVPRRVRAVPDAM